MPDGVDGATAIIDLVSTALTGGADSYTQFVFVANDAAVAEQPPLTKIVRINLDNIDDNDPVAGEIELADGVVPTTPPELTLADTPDDQGANTLVAISLDTATLANDVTMTQGVLAAADGTAYLYGTAAQYQLNSEDAVFKTAHGLADDADWWVYEGVYGDLVIRADGTLSYVLTADPKPTATASDHFVLTLTDAAGDDVVIELHVPINVDVAAEDQALPDIVSSDADYYLEVAEDHSGVLFTLPVTDADGDPITHEIISVWMLQVGVTGVWEIDPDTDMPVRVAVTGLFEIDTATGEVRLADGMSLDHEILSSITIIITSTSTSTLPSDAAGSPPRDPQTLTQTVTLKVIDVNEAPTEILTDGNTDRVAYPLVIDLPDGAIPEEGVLVTTLTVTDQDDSRFEAQNWGAITGADAASFEIRTDEEGEVTLWLRAGGRVPLAGETWDITLTVRDKGGLSFDTDLDIIHNGLFLTQIFPQILPSEVPDDPIEDLLPPALRSTMRGKSYLIPEMKRFLLNLIYSIASIPMVKP